MRVVEPRLKMSRSRSLGEGFRVGQNVCVLDCSFLGTCWATAARSLALSTEGKIEKQKLKKTYPGRLE